MAKSLRSYEDSEDDYIDIEVGTCINFLGQSQGSPPSPREFEFQMSSTSLSKDTTTTSPADELFYQGKLLPLHLPPRLQMVEMILQSSSSSISSIDYRTDACEDIFNTPSVTAPNTPTTTSTPFESCNNSPSESFRMSMELNQEDYLRRYANEISDFVTETTKMCTAKKSTNSLLGLKLKASKALLKSLFGKYGCSHDSSAAAFTNTQKRSVIQPKDSSSSIAFQKVAKKIPIGKVQKENKCKKSAEVFGDKDRESGGCHRTSLSGVIKHRLTPKSTSFSSTSSASSSSSSSSDSIGFQELPFFKNSSIASSDIEISIKGAIAHCKESHQTCRSGSRTALNEIKCSFPSSA